MATNIVCYYNLAPKQGITIVLPVVINKIGKKKLKKKKLNKSSRLSQTNQNKTTTTNKTTLTIKKPSQINKKQPHMYYLVIFCSVSAQGLKTGKNTGREHKNCFPSSAKAAKL